MTWWLEQLEAYCFTAVIGVDEDELIRRLGGDPTDLEPPRTFDECFWPAAGPQWAQVGPVGGGLMVAEHNGWRCEESAARLSEGGQLATFFRNVEAVMHFVYAVDGTVIADFDPLLDPRAPRIETALQGLAFGLHAAESSAVSLIERLTGVVVRDAWLRRPQRVVRLPPLEALT